MLPIAGLAGVLLVDAVVLIAALYTQAISLITLIILGLATHILVSATAMRLLNRLFPIREGTVKVGSEDFHRWQAQAVIALFSSVYFDAFLPMPLKAPWFRLFGAKIAPGVVVSGRIVDCSLVTIEKGSIIGLNAVILGHTVGQETTQLGSVLIEADTIIGAGSVILPGVHVKQGASIGVGAVVTSGKQIQSGETWVGVPARPLRQHPQTLP
jgi:serine acetyltransferase